MDKERAAKETRNAGKQTKDQHKSRVGATSRHSPQKERHQDGGRQKKNGDQIKEREGAGGTGEKEKFARERRGLEATTRRAGGHRRAKEPARHQESELKTQKDVGMAQKKRKRRAPKRKEEIRKEQQEPGDYGPPKSPHSSGT